MADRVERLTNLLALLLESAEPVSLVQIADELAGQYPDAAPARRAAFERDKAALREIGVPIEQEIMQGGDAPGQTRYWVDRARYELDELQLDDDEMRALQVAIAATRPGSTSGQEALWKLGGGLAESVGPVTAVVPELPALPIVRAALTEHHPVAFRYRDVDRVVEPWGLLLRTGFWYLVGYDRGRADQRTFRIDRIDGDVTALTEEAFERPTEFDPRSAFPEDPKAIGAGERVPEARVLIDATRATLTERELGTDRVVARRADGSIEVVVPCAHPPAFRSWVLGHLEHAEVLAPPDVRADLVAWLETVVA